MFAWFESTESKSRINFLKLLRAGHCDYVLNAEALGYMAANKLSKEPLARLAALGEVRFENEKEWKEKLQALEINKNRHIYIATEGALLGSVLEHGFDPQMAIISDDAGQFNLWTPMPGYFYIPEKTLPQAVRFLLVIGQRSS